MSQQPDNAIAFTQALIERQIPDFTHPLTAYTYDDLEVHFSAILQDFRNGLTSGRYTQKDVDLLDFSVLRSSLERPVALFPGQSLDTILITDSFKATDKIDRNDYSRTALLGLNIADIAPHRSIRIASPFGQSISNNMISEPWYLELIERDDSVALFAKYDQIIGSRKLTVVDKEAGKQFLAALKQVNDRNNDKVTSSTMRP